MNNKFLYFGAFVVGALTGSAATWYFLKDKYAKIAQEEIDSVKERFRSEKKEPEVVVQTRVIKEKPSLVQKVEDILDDNGYKDYSDISKQDKEEEARDMSEPYIISPEEFDEEGYESVSLTYYRDDILADSITDEIIENPLDVVGDFKGHFGEYEDDSVFVRNDRLQIDYEILLDDRNYKDIVSDKHRDFE